jgi:hypothetical protein
MTKLIVAFRNFVKAPKNVVCKLQTSFASVYSYSWFMRYRQTVKLVSETMRVCLF